VEEKLPPTSPLPPCPAEMRLLDVVRTTSVSKRTGPLFPPHWGDDADGGMGETSPNKNKKPPGGFKPTGVSPVKKKPPPRPSFLTVFGFGDGSFR
jgi:hypothetical protein